MCVLDGLCLGGLALVGKVLGRSRPSPVTNGLHVVDEVLNLQTLHPHANRLNGYGLIRAADYGED